LLTPAEFSRLSLAGWSAIAPKLTSGRVRARAVVRPIYRGDKKCVLGEFMVFIYQMFRWLDF